MEQASKNICMEKRTPGRKKLFAILSLLLAAALFVSACGESKMKTSNKAISVGKQAIKTVDDYLDGNLSYEEAKDKIDELKDAMSYVDTLDKDAENYWGDKMVDSSLLGIAIDLISNSYQGSSEDYDKLIEERNELAEKIGEKKRE